MHPHLGGTIPYVLGRLDRIGAAGREARVSEYLRTRFYTDTVGPTGPALQLAIDAYGIDRVLFGTDYPYLDMARLVAFVEENASQDDAAAILHRNTVGRILAPVGD